MKNAISTVLSRRFLVLYFALCAILAACSVQKKVQRSAMETVLKAPALQTAHIGISIYEPATGKYWYNHQGDKYFVPASNVKIPTCYAAMKYLGDSLVGGRIAIDSNGMLELYPSGDPTFLHSEFPFQPLLHELQKYKSVYVFDDAWKEQRWGSGWSWNDYDASYMAERSLFPIFGNVAAFRLYGDTIRSIPSKMITGAQKELGFNNQSGVVISKNFSIGRSLDDNDFNLKAAPGKFSRTDIPLRTELGIVCVILEDTLKSKFIPAPTAKRHISNSVRRIIRSQPTDSLLKPMMHRSDNFFAEQALLMVSIERLGVMSDAKIIDTILKTDFADLPQKPRWVDGSGLSRYNLFTPQDMVAILGKMQREFGMARIKTVFATGNEGTLTNYYKADSGYLYAKTGTLSGVVAISGFMETAGGKSLIFSVLVNNHQASATDVRRAAEAFLQGLRKKY
jgi:D-alanyl-D-alanine carboxypeptidase/D-alanyl-D-alanine-endopeptidase (penicillin-binding protein 4)